MARGLKRIIGGWEKKEPRREAGLNSLFAARGTSIKIPKYQYVGRRLRILDEMW